MISGIDLELLARVASLAPLFVVAGVKVFLLGRDLLPFRRDGKTEYLVYYPLDTYVDSTYRPEAAPLLRRFRVWIGLQFAGALVVGLGLLVWELLDPAMRAAR